MANEPRSAFIEYETERPTGLTLLLMELREKGIDCSFEKTLETFETKHGSLNNFPILFYHPGLGKQNRIAEVISKYHKLKVVLMTSPCSGGDYDRVSGIHIVSYDQVRFIEKMILEANQQRHV